MIEKIPESLLDDIVKGSCIPIIGAGFSRNAILLPGEEMPDWVTLGKELANLISNYPYSSPLDAISAYSHENSRVKLVEKLVKFLHIGTAMPGPVHQSFCKLPFDKVCTTNFDFLLEKAYDMPNSQLHCRPVIDQEQLSMSIDNNGVFLLKLHGDVNHPNRLIVEEKDYDSFIDKYPLIATYLGNLLITRTPLLIGYSLEDPDFRQIWQIIKERLGNMRRPAYVITVGVKSHEIARYERRGVKVINLHNSTSKYGEKLEQLFTELRDYWPLHLLQNSISVDADTENELVIPKDSPNRLCYFSIPPTLKSFYKSLLFPIVEDLGLVPVIDESIISPSGNVLAKIMALMDRAQYVVADLSSAQILSEIYIAISRKLHPPRILLILEEGSEVPIDFKGIDKVFRPKDLTKEPNGFILEIEEWFNAKSKMLRPTLSEEPLRLLNKKEYKAAVISAFILLEITLQDALYKFSNNGEFLENNFPKHTSLVKMAKYSLDYQLIDRNEYDIIMETRRTRNKLVHLDVTISPKNATNIVNDIMEIITKLKRG